MYQNVTVLSSLTEHDSFKFLEYNTTPINTIDNGTLSLSTNDSSTDINITTISQQEDDDDGPVGRHPIWSLALFKMSHDMYPVYTLLFFIIGIVGNSLSLAVILQRRMRSVSSAVFIACLAVADNITLLGFLLGMISRSYFPQIVSKHFCHMYQYLVSTGSMTSAWTVVAMTFERALVVSFPLKAPSWTSRTRAGIAVAVVLIFCMFHSSHIFWTSLAIRGVCVYNHQDYGTFLGIYSLYDSFMAFYVPLVVILVLNIVIIAQMKKARGLQKKMTNKNPATKSEGEGQNKTDSATNQITVMLLSVSICFFLCMTPYAIHQILSNYVFDLNIMPYREYAKFYFAFQVCMMLWEVNHSINFILYSLTGRKFRAAMLDLFICREFQKKQKYRGSGTESSTVKSSSITSPPRTVNTVS